MKLFNQALTIAVALFLLSQNSIAADKVASVKVLPVKEIEESPTTDILGTIYSRNRAQLTAAINGKLEWVLEPGSHIEKGALVARVETLGLQLQQAEQNAQLKRARINLQYLGRELKRQKELRKLKNASQYELEQTQSQYELAKSDLEIAELRLKQVNDQLQRAEIRAPFSGVITQRMQRAGTDVNRSDVIVQLLDTESLEARLFVPVKYLSYIRPGTKVMLTSIDDEKTSLSARASAIIPAADPRSQTFEMRINLPDESKNIWAAGQLVKVNIPIEDTRMSLTVHRDALILRNDGIYVVKVDQNNKSLRLKVTVGKGNGDWVTVRGDLKAGEKVVIRGAERLKDGDAVAIQPAS